YDKAGNTPTSTLLSLFNVQVDTNAPLAPTNIHANPQANENWKSTTTYTFTWDSPSNPGDVAPISDYCWKINSSGFTCLGSNAVTTGAQVLLGLNQGTNTFYVYAKDEAGNFNTGVTGSVAFQFDSLDPTSAVNMANTYYGPVANPTNLALLGTASDDKSSGVGSYSDLLKTEIKIQRADTKWYNFTAGSWDLGESADTLNNGGSGETWSYSLPISKLLSGVSYTVYSKATDNAAPANVQDAFAQDVFAWDDAAPTSLVSAFSGSYYSLPSKPASVTGTNSDTGGSNTSIVKIRIRDDQNSYWTGSGWGALTDLSATNTGTSFSTWSYDLSAVTWQQGKTYNFGVYGVDGVNNTETYHEDRSFIYDNTQAVISLTPADTFQDNTAITVNKAMADAESGIVTCLLEKKTGDLVSGATQNWGAYAQVDTTCDNSYSTTGLTAKAYKFKLTVTNGSGITNSTESGGIKIDTTAPMVDSFSYSDGFNTTGNFTVTKTESDPQSGIKAVELLEYFAPLNDNAVGEWSLANTITAGGNYSKTGAPSGAYKYEYRVQNNSNIWSNLSTSANIVKVDTALPAEVGSMAALGTDSTTIKVTWNLPVETHSGVSQFVIERTAKLDTYNANTDPTTYTYSALSKTINVSALPADVTYSAGTYAFMDTASGMTDQSWYAYRMKTIDRAGNDSGYIYDGTPTSADNYKAGKTNTPPAVSNLVLTPNGNLTPPQTINISFDVTDPDYLDVYNDLDSFFNPTGGLIQVRVLSGQGTEVMGWTNASRSPITDGYSAVSSYSFPSGAPYGTYTVAVKAVDSVGVYPRQSGTSTATFTYQPEPVTNIAAIGTDQNSAVNLTWTAPRTNSVDSAVTGIEKYVVERKIDADGESYGNAVDVLANSANHQGSGNYLLNDQGLTVLQYYKYRVKTVDVSGNSSGWVETSNSVTVPDTSAPSSVDDLIVSSVGSNGTSVNLSWTVPADNSDSATEPTIQSLKGVQQFKVYRRTADTNFVSGDLVKTITKGTDPEFSVLSTVGSPITLVDTGLTEATAYYYLVTVLDKALPEGDAYNPNESTLTPTSNQNSATLTTLTVPKNVQTKSASSDSNGRVIVYWQALDANYNNAPLAPYDFDAYIIERQVEGEGWNASYQTITDFARNYYIDEGANISNLSLNYTYRVKVRNANGNVSEVSSQTTIRPADVGDTTKPVITFDFNNVTKTPSSITIPFTTDEAVFGVVEYGTVSNNLDQTKSTGLFATSHSIVLSNLNSDTDYFFRIKAIDGSGNTETKLNNEVPYQITTDIDNGAPTNPDAGNGYGDQQKSNQLLFGGWFNIAHPYFEWNAGTDINSAISGYYVYFGTNPNADPSLTAGILTSNEDAKRFEAGTSLTVTESLTSGQTYYLRIKTKDTSGNISATAKTLFDYKYDATLPDSKIYTPRNGDTVDSVSIAGTASDDHANINRVLVRIKRTQGQTITYWSGATGEWVDSENTWNLAAGLTNWTYSNGSLNWDMGTTYNIESKAYDNTENEQAAPDSISFTYGTVDRDAPIITFAAEALADANDTVGLEAGVTSVKIKWTTNEGADSAVLYRKEGESEYRKGNIDPKIIGQTSHEITLSGLTSDTKYFFKLRSDDASSNRAETEELNFTTVSLGISEPKVVTTSSSANITWTTNVNSSSQAEYQKQNSNIPSKIEGSSELSKDHSVVIKPLTPGRYSYKVKSIDNDNNIGESPLLYFEIPTADTNTISEPKTGKVEEKEITATSAKITWESTIATTSWIEYGTESAVYSMLSGNNDLAKSHIVELKNLTPGTLYYYRVKGADANEIEYVSPEYSFTATLKPQVSNIKTKNVSYYAATIFWETNVSTDTIMAFGKDESLGQRKGNQEVGKAHEIVLDNIEDNAQYFYQIISRDKHGNEVRSDVLNFKTPLDTRGPEINDIKIDLLPMGAEDEYAGVIISWNTDKDSSKQIEYGEGVVSGKYDFRTTEDQNASTGHTVIIRDLNPSSTYHFRIKATDKRGNQTNSQDFSFVTPTKEKSILQLIIKSLEETFSWVKNIGGLLKRS
ncbi:MAG: Cytochrome C family protein, partial [candidate division CPR2 bacterium GW2011_GWC2_39_35]